MFACSREGYQLQHKIIKIETVMKRQEKERGGKDEKGSLNHNLCKREKSSAGNNI